MGQSRAERRQIQERVVKDYCNGAKIKDLVKKYDVSRASIARWCKDKDQEVLDFTKVDDELVVDPVRDITVIKSDTVESLKTRNIVPGSPVFKAKTLELAELKYGAGLDFQLAQAAWLVNCRYQLVIKTESMNGVVTYHKIPVLSENIDWERGIVQFDGCQYNTD